tara:strand:- start:750 stop:1367 length:618 start_codon:yes stop_codon:yes gene_type:complete
MEKKTTKKPTKKTMSFVDKIISIQSELKAPKNQFNSFGKYKYRSLEDIQTAIKPYLAKHGLFMTFNDEIMELGGVIFVQSSCIVTDGKETLTTKAQAGIDPAKKGMDLAQCFGSSSSYSRKYSCGAMWLIDDQKDSDATNTHDNVKKVSVPVKVAPEKKTLNDNQFIRMLGAIQNGEFSVKQANKDYTLSTKQIADLKQLENEKA